MTKRFRTVDVSKQLLRELETWMKKHDPEGYRSIQREKRKARSKVRR